MSRSSAKKVMQREPEQFSGLLRDIRGQFIKGVPALVVLKHVRMGKSDGDQDVSRWEGGHFEGLDPQSFTQQVIEVILEDSKIFPADQLQRYALYIYRKNLSAHDHRIFVSTQGGADSSSGDVFPSEEPNDRGRGAQIMRHDEAFSRLAVEALSRALSSKDRDNDRLAEMNNTLMSQLVPTVQAVSGILTRTAELDFALEQKRKLYALLEQGGEKFMQVAPFLLAAKVEQKNPAVANMIRKAASDPAREILNVLMKDIDAKPEAGQALFAALTALPNGTAILQALIQMAQQEKASGANGAAPKESSPGDAGGDNKEG